MAIETRTRNTTEKPPTSAFLDSRKQPGIALINGPEQLGVFAGGQVWLSPVLMQKDITIAHVHFEPGARTNWHKHEGGQLLRITAGSGWVCDQGEKPRRVAVGDTIWCPPGCIHWHGADDGSFLGHEATSFGGLDWYEPVSEAEYAAKNEI